MHCHFKTDVHPLYFDTPQQIFLLLHTFTLFFSTFEYIVDMSDRSPNNFSAHFTVLNDISAPQRETGGVPSRQSSVSSPSTASLVVGVSSVDPFCNFRRFHSSPSFSSTFVALFIYFTSRKTCSTFKYISWNIFGWQQSWSGTAPQELLSLVYRQSLRQICRSHNFVNNVTFYSGWVMNKYDFKPLYENDVKHGLEQLIFLTREGCVFV